MTEPATDRPPETEAKMIARLTLLWAETVKAYAADPTKIKRLMESDLWPHRDQP